VEEPPPTQWKRQNQFVLGIDGLVEGIDQLVEGIDGLVEGIDDYHRQ
jgi:hypothetical protein